MNPQSSNAEDSEGQADKQGAPRWVKGMGAVGLVLILVFVILHLTGLAPDHHFGHPAGHAGEMTSSTAARP